MKPSTILSIALACAACAKTDKPAADTSAAAGAATGAEAMKAGETGGMKTPESVRYDSALDVFFVSNINGNPSAKDGNGFIAIVRADSTGVVRMLAESGKASGGGKAPTLDAPKGMAIV